MFHWLKICGESLTQRSLIQRGPLGQKSDHLKEAYDKYWIWIPVSHLSTSCFKGARFLRSCFFTKWTHLGMWLGDWTKKWIFSPLDPWFWWFFTVCWVCGKQKKVQGSSKLKFRWRLLMGSYECPECPYEWKKSKFWLIFERLKFLIKLIF
jgi:hypothetical protein